MHLRSKIALVTGGAHRLGKAIALALAGEGCQIALHYHAAAEQAEQTQSELGRLGVTVRVYQADLRDPDQRQALFAGIQQDFGRLDVLINSAAIMERIAIEEVTEGDWSATIDLNLQAVFFCTQAAARLMGESGGAVINISDIAGLQPWADYPVHSISKSGVEMLTKVAARALKPGVRVNAVAPGPVLKPDRLAQERWERIGAALPLGRTGEPADIAQAVIFLLTNDFINGETLVVDGGNQLV